MFSAEIGGVPSRGPFLPLCTFPPHLSSKQIQDDRDVWQPRDPAVVFDAVDILRPATAAVGGW